MEDQDNPFPERDRKQHNPLNERLKKKWEKLKQHKREKKIKHEAYDREKKREEYFEKGQKKRVKDPKKDSYGVKVRKLKKTILKFTNVYVDELKDFYDIWKGLDDGGQVEIDEVEDPKIRKCLKSMCRYLQLRRQGRVYSKGKHNKLNLESYIKRKLEEVMEEYMEHGTDSQEEQESDEEGNQQPQEKKVEKPKPKEASKTVTSGPMLPPPINSKKATQQIVPQPRPVQVGPYIPREQREQIEQLWTEGRPGQSNTRQLPQQDQIDKIFGYIGSKKQQQAPQEPKYNYAKGSAPMNYETNQQEAARYMEEYNRLYRNKSLVEQHRQMLRNNQVEKSQGAARKPFSREQLLSSDKVDMKRLNEMLQGGVFYDFKDKFTKPSDKKSYL